MPPGTPFTPDLQSWMRNDPGLAPDWLRIGTDIIGGTTFNGSFALSGHTVKREADDPGGDSAAKGSPDLTPPVTGGTLADQTAVASLTVDDAQSGLSNAQTVLTRDNVPAVTATLTQSSKLQKVAVSWKSEPPHGQGVVETALDEEAIAEHFPAQDIPA